MTETAATTCWISRLVAQYKAKGRPQQQENYYWLLKDDLLQHKDRISVVHGPKNDSLLLIARTLSTLNQFLYFFARRHSDTHCRNLQQWRV